MDTFTSKPWYKTMAVLAITPAHPLDHVLRAWSKAMISLDSVNWVIAINEDVAAMHQLGVWEVVPQLPSYTVIGTDWVFCCKYDTDGNPDQWASNVGGRPFTAKSCVRAGMAFHWTDGTDGDKTICLGEIF